MEYKPHRVTDTGEIVLIRKVSPLLAQAAQRQIPKPRPPMNRVDYGDGDVRDEPNPADPAYQEALAAWQEALEARVRLIAIRMGVAIEWTEEKRQRLAELRQVAGEIGIEIESDDTVAFVSHIAIGTADDYQELVEAIMQRVRPTEEAIAEAVETFRPQVAG